MKCSSIGYHHLHNKSFKNYRPNGSQDWLLLLLKSPAVFYINDEVIHTKSDSFIIYSLDTPQHYSADNQDYIDDWLHFYPDEEELRLIEELSIPLNRPVYLGNIEVFSSIIRNMCFEFYSAHQNRNEIVTLYFRMLLYKLHEQKNFRYSDTILTQTKYMPNLLWIRESIFRWPEQEWCVDTLAKELEISNSRFQHIYTKAFGSTMIQDVIDSRIQRGCELLRDTSMGIADIAETCGYSSVPHFTHLFRSRTGVTPQTYRKLHKKS